MERYSRAEEERVMCASGAQKHGLFTSKFRPLFGAFLVIILLKLLLDISL
jgi:hypothetical protein